VYNTNIAEGACGACADHSSTKRVILNKLRDAIEGARVTVEQTDKIGLSTRESTDETAVIYYYGTTYTLRYSISAGVEHVGFA
jgi:hypothetical protein